MICICILSCFSLYLCRYLAIFYFNENVWALANSFRYLYRPNYSWSHSQNLTLDIHFHFRSRNDFLSINVLPLICMSSSSSCFLCYTKQINGRRDVAASRPSVYASWLRWLAGTQFHSRHEAKLLGRYLFLVSSRQVLGVRRESKWNSSVSRVASFLPSVVKYSQFFCLGNFAALCEHILFLFISFFLLVNVWYEERRVISELLQKFDSLQTEREA